MAEEERKVWDRRQRCLLYVAASRARDELVVTGWGAPSPFLKDAPEAPAGEEKDCPKCGRRGPIATDFGMRKTTRTKADGTVIVDLRPQSYCRECRKKKRG